MTILSFTKEFAPAVENKTKWQTIRNGKHQFKVGEKLQLYKGRYAPGERIKMHDAICLSVQEIYINLPNWKKDPFDSIGIEIDGKPFVVSEIDDFIALDGFKTDEQFIKYFKTKDGKPFTGQLIQWGLEFTELEVGHFYIDSNDNLFKITDYHSKDHNLKWEVAP